MANQLMQLFLIGLLLPCDNGMKEDYSHSLVPYIELNRIEILKLGQLKFV